ncbi:MAG: DUF2188 domain-containing protein [Chloroflexota bacterium]|jgi:hypothetical protein
MKAHRDKKRSPKKNQWVIRHGDKWGVRGEGNRRLTRITDTQEEAIRIATRIAQKQGAEVIVQGNTGKIHSAFYASLERSLDENRDVWQELSKH